jgi:hypothetical protein
VLDSWSRSRIKKKRLVVKKRVDVRQGAWYDEGVGDEEGGESLCYAMVR